MSIKYVFWATLAILIGEIAGALMALYIVGVGPKWFCYVGAILPILSGFSIAQAIKQ